MNKKLTFIAGFILIITKVIYVLYLRNISHLLWCGIRGITVIDILWLISSFMLILNIKYATPTTFILTGIAFLIGGGGCELDRSKLLDIFGSIAFISCGIYQLKDYFKKSIIIKYLWFIPIIFSICYSSVFIYYFKTIVPHLIGILFIISYLLICIPKKKH